MRIPIESACWRLCACSEAPASCCASAASYGLSKDVVIVPIIESELKFREVQRQVLPADVVVGADNAALQEAPEILDVVRVNLTANVFLGPVINCFVATNVIRHPLAIACTHVSRDQIHFLRNGLVDEAIERVDARILNDLTDDIALARDRADDGGLAGVGRAAAAILLAGFPVPVFLFAADVGFVHFNDSHELLELRIFHRRPQPMAHIPSRLVCTASDLPLNLESADALLAVKDLPENLEPSLERILGVLENRPADDAEAVVLAGLAEPMEGPRFQDINFVAIATRATDNAVSPAMLQHKLLAGFVRRKGFHQSAERHHGS